MILRNWERVVGGNLEHLKPDVKMIVIDHHASNEGYGDVNLVDHKSTSVSEMIYKLLEDWRVKPDKNIAVCLLTGIIGDTGSFRFPNVDPATFEITADLMRLGADRDNIIFNLFYTVDFKELKYLSEILKEAVVDLKRKNSLGCNSS